MEFKMQLLRNHLENSTDVGNTQSEHLDIALETMHQGLCMYGPDKKIIISNNQFAEIYKISPELIRLGTSQEEIIDLRIKNGTFAGSSPEEYLRERSVNLHPRHSHADATIHHLNDGRYVEIRDHPLIGGGRLSTHEDITERYLAEKKIKHMANFDTLTNLPNRMHVNKILQSAIDDAISNGTRMSLLYIDLDGFKRTNDTLGHQVGDCVLEQVGARLANLQNDQVTAGRLAGDEFIVVVENTDDVNELQHVGDKICSTLAATISVEHNNIDLSASVGISVGPPSDGRASTFLHKSDLALYQAKKDGGNSYRFFEEAMFQKAQKYKRIAADLRLAAHNGELRVYYQPQCPTRN